MPDKNSDHWLVREGTIKQLWKWSIIGLVVLVLLDFLVTHHPHFGIDGTIGFNAWYGFISCVGLVLFAKLLGLILKKPDTYYDD